MTDHTSSLNANFQPDEHVKRDDDHEAAGPLRDRYIRLFRHATVVACFIGAVRLAPYVLQ